MPEQTLPMFINPTAGRGRAAKRLSRIVELFANEDIALDVHESLAVGDLEKRVQAAAAGGAKTVIIAGGDGSIHEAVNGLQQAGNDCALAVVPTGTGNDFAKAAGVPLDWQAAVRILADRVRSNAPCRRIDIGRMNGRCFANGAGVGFDARVTALARAYRWPVGDLVYLLAIFRAMLDGIATPQMTIRADEFEWHDAVTLASVSNGPWIGGMFHIAPMADHADGRLELLVAAPVTRRRILTLLPKLMNGEHLGEAEISHAGVRSLTIESASPVPSHLDGEVGEVGTRFEIEVLPGAQRLR